MSKCLHANNCSLCTYLAVVPSSYVNTNHGVLIISENEFYSYSMKNRSRVLCYGDFEAYLYREYLYRYSFV